MNKEFYIEVGYRQKNHIGERICGDVFIFERVREENRTVLVLSDGLGHGVKANVLATLTSKMALNFTKEHKSADRIAEIIMNTLPVCSERKISYSTFTIIDIEHNGETRILEYDNPQSIVIRDNKSLMMNWSNLLLVSDKNRGKEIRYCNFTPRKEDRIIICSDGVVQSGMGSYELPFGWGNVGVENYLISILPKEKKISAVKLATKIVNRAVQNDNFISKDDTTCAVIYFRDPRRMLICTGPPFEAEKDKVLADTFHKFDGIKVICGATTVEIIGRELGREIFDSFEFEDPDLPPVSFMKGADLITEGILTLTKVSNILSHYTNDTTLGKGPADLIVKLFLESDEIYFLIGTGINIAHQDPNLPVELEIRRSVVKRIAGLLEKKFLKEVNLEFI